MTWPQFSRLARAVVLRGGLVPGIVITSLLHGAPPLSAGNYTWLSTFTDGSSKELAALHAEILKPRLEGTLGVPVVDLHWKAPLVDIHIVRGTIWIEPPVQGAPVLAFFSGEATLTFAPTCSKGREDLRYWLGKDVLQQEPVTDVLFYTLEERSLLDRLGVASASGSVPFSARGAYALSKAALGQLGTDLVRAFLDRKGASREGSYIVLTAPAIRGRKASDEALLLYRNDPELPDESGLYASGHGEIVETGRSKFTWWRLSSCRQRQGPYPGPGAAEVYTIQVVAGRSADSAEEETEIRFLPAPGVRALKLLMTPQLEVQEIRGSDGAPLPFLQWTYLLNDPNYDQTLLVALNETVPPGQPAVLRVRAAGTLFEPWGTAHYIVDEDDWHPRLDGAQAATFDVTIDVPKDHMAVAAGALVKDVKVENARRFQYRSTKPLKMATLYHGDFTSTVGKADDTEIRVYGDKNNLDVRKNLDYLKTEIENIVKVYDRIYRPLEFPILRVVGILGEHGRGFEGLILLGRRAGFDRASSSSDVFRAHEVAHQWWGNTVQPMNWPEDRWLSESFAEYSAMEYYRIRYEDDAKTNERIYIEWIKPIVEPATVTVWTLKGEKQEYVAAQISPISDGGAKVYTKGPAVLHMLRYAFKVAKGSDAPFWEMLRTFLQAHPYQQVSTADFIAHAERALGGPIPWFWGQWVYGRQIPTVRWSESITPRDGKFLLTVTGEQTGTDFTLMIPVFIHFKGDRTMSRPLAIKGAKGQMQVLLPEEPLRLTLNDSWEALVNLKK